MAALCAGIKAGGDSRTVEFISARDVATMNTSMKVRQFAPGAIRVACHLSPRFGRVPATTACGIVLDARLCNWGQGVFGCVYFFVSTMNKGCLWQSKKQQRKQSKKRQRAR
jgi:hypothetical protein